MVVPVVVAIVGVALTVALLMRDWEGGGGEAFFTGIGVLLIMALAIASSLTWLTAIICVILKLLGVAPVAAWSWGGIVGIGALGIAGQVILHLIKEAVS